MIAGKPQHNKLTKHKTRLNVQGLVHYLLSYHCLLAIISQHLPYY